MRALWLAFVLALMPALAQTQTDYVPLDQVKPGMKGQGCTVFFGTERALFDVAIRGLVPHFGVWPMVIVAELHGGPGNIMDQHQVFSGMSGSPTSAGGKLVGGLAMSPDFATTAKVLITPIEYMLAMGDGLPESSGSSIAQPCDYIATCFVYGDDQSCFESTVTEKRAGYLYAASHDVGIPYGTIALPVFIVPVADLLEAQKEAVKLPGELAEPVGAAVVSGRFGIVIREGSLPTTVAIHYTLEGVGDASGSRTSFMAYHLQAPKMFQEQCGAYLQQFIPENVSSHLEVSITVDSLHAVIRFTDTSGAGLNSLEELLSALIVQEGPSLVISSIDMRFTVLPTEELRYPLTIQTSGKNEHGVVTVLAQQFRKQSVSQVSEPLDLRPIKPYRKKEPVWMDGAKLQSKILQRMSVRQALPLLERTREHEGLYLVWSESNDAIKLGPSADGWQGHIPQILILASTTMNGSRFFLPPATASLPYVHK